MVLADLIEELRLVFPHFGNELRSQEWLDQRLIVLLASAEGVQVLNQLGDVVD